MTATEPPAKPDPRPVSEIIKSLLAKADEPVRQHELDRGGDPGGWSYFLLEVRGVPQAVSGPYGQAEPESAAASEAELGHHHDGPELHPGTEEYEAEYAEYQSWAGQARPEAEAEAEPGPELEAEP
jgi:hypothetical protein